MSVEAVEVGFRQTVEQMRVAVDRFVQGDPEPLKALCSRREDVSIFGGWGGQERGWEEVAQRTIGRPAGTKVVG